MPRFVVLSLLILSCSAVVQAMEPVGYSGTWASAAYFNNAIDVISETVNIDITDDANNAGYKVSYKLYNNREGLQFPLVFEVFDEFGQSNEFEITVDGQSVPVVTVTEDNNGLETSELLYTSQYWFRAIQSRFKVYQFGFVVRVAYYYSYL